MKAFPKINTIIKVFLITLLLVFINLKSNFSYAQQTYSDAYLQANHSNSVILHDNYLQQLGLLAVDDCFSTGKVITSGSEFNTTCMPGVLSPGNTSCQSSPAASEVLALQITRGIVYSGLIAASLGLFLIVIGVEYAIMTDVCTNAYIVQAWEYMNRTVQQIGCTITNNFVNWDPGQSNKRILTETDVPFFYSCSPGTDPTTGTAAWGYMGAASQYCIGDNAQFAKPDFVGVVVVEMYPALNKIPPIVMCTNANTPTSYNTDAVFDGSSGKYAAALKPSVYGPESTVVTTNAYIDFLAYYKFDPTAGKIQLCVAAPYTLFPVRVGCGYVAPPGEDNPIDDFLIAYVQGTRCYYLLDSREDLNSLGGALLGSNSTATDDTGAQRIAVTKFLQSELHFTSTVVGCIKDMLQKIFIQAPISGFSATSEPFFQVVQGRLQQIVLAVLVLYVVIVGISIMTSPQPPDRAKFIMWIIKYSLVMYFALGDAFYSTDSNGNVTGLYPQLLSVSDEIADLFLNAQNQFDPIGYCTFISGGENILSERMIDVSAFGGNLTPTAGYTGVKMTVWDLVDCKVANYLNGGSCDYTPSGMVLVWASSLSMLAAGGNGVIISLVTFMYCFMILMVIFKFAHIFILAAIIITILLFLAPIFVCFFLFEVTKGIFDKWMKTIFGYMLYPALLFAFLALMLATLDSIYYGPLNNGTVTNQNVSNVNLNAGTQIGSAAIQISVMCQNVDSIFCDVNGISNYSSDMCSQPASYFANAWIETFDPTGLGTNFSRLNTTAIQIFQKHMLTLMLFAFLFFLFMNAVSSFMAALLGVQELSMAKGGINAFNIMSSIGGAVKGGVKKAAGKATEK